MLSLRASAASRPVSNASLTPAVRGNPMKTQLLRALYEGACVAGHRVGLHEPQVTHRDAIMMYHSVRRPQRVRAGTSDISVSEFRRHLQYFDEQFEVVDRAARQNPAPAR